MEWWRPRRALAFSSLGWVMIQRGFEIGPTINGIPTHVPDILSLFIVLAVVVRIVVRLIDAIVAPGLRWASRMITHGVGRRRNGDASASREPAHADRGMCVHGFYLWSTMAIPSVIFLLTIDVYFYHYYFVLCPFLFVLVAACLLRHHIILGMVIAQALMSSAFLSYIHHKGGAVRGEYGLTYARQLNQ